MNIRGTWPALALAIALAALSAEAQVKVGVVTSASGTTAFVGGAQASDDLTLVIVRWMGPELARVSRPAAA